MIYGKRALVILAVGGASWWLASFWCVSASERFYVMVPLAALAVFFTGLAPVADDKGQLGREFWAQIRSVAALLIAVVVLEVCAMSWAFGPRVLLSSSCWMEAGTILYLLTAFLIVLLGSLRLLLLGTDLLARRCHGAALIRNVLAPTAALVLFLSLALPFGIAFSYVYRFKIPNLANPQSELGRHYEDVEFVSVDGTQLRGWWIPAKSPSSRTLVLCHGLAVNRTMTLPFCEIGDWLDANIFMFDLRGHGNSGGRTISLGNLETTDALAAIEYVREHRREESQQVVGMGLSLGAAVMAEAAGRVEPPLAGVILDSGFASTREMTQNLPCPPFLHDWMLTVGLPLANWHAGTPIMTFCPEASIGNLRAPVVVAHARLDPITPSDHSRRFFERAAEPKQLLLFEINGHCDGFFAEKDRYQTAIRRLGEQMQVGFQGR